MTKCDLGYCCTKIQHLGVAKGSDIILQDVSFHIHCGQLTSVIGRNGAGKTTLLKALLGEIKHTGSISFHNHSGKEKRLRIGYVPQKLSLEDSPTSVYDMFAAFLSHTPVFLMQRRKVRSKILAQLSGFHAEQLIDKRICDLSGGELQRVLLSLAMTPVPDILLMDEPVSGMDQKGMELFYHKLMELKTAHDIAIIMVSHDFQYVKRYSDRVILLDKQVVKDDTPEAVLASKEFKQIFRVDWNGGTV